MDTIQALAILISLAAAFAYINHRLLGMPMTIGLMLLSLLLSLALTVMNHFGLPMENFAEKIARGVDFRHFLLDGMLGLLLFAGALHVNLDDLFDQWIEISIFATLGVAASTFLVGLAVHGISLVLGLNLGLMHCFVFGALISPTDPIAVLGIMKKARAPKSLAMKITGESLFNDGIGVVAFLALSQLAAGHGDLGAGHMASLFAKEVAGGLLFGLGAGYLAYLMLKSVDNYQVEVLITLALVLGGYALAQRLHMSGPLAMVASGLLIGNRGRNLAMSTRTREHLDTFWELIDETLNALLFVLIGVEVLVLSFSRDRVAAGFLAVLAGLAARYVSLGVPMLAIRRFRVSAPWAVRIMTWGGLRGGISVALALSLPPGPARETILTMTYVVVAFSILAQGLTVGKLVDWSIRRRDPVE